ncbi:hypothetical protein [Cyclobacterium qasimii]|uniref:Uncharacterized protein n=1 Tax=Cyclobacterium qasimii TaxID=1350429 RepID=A0A512CH45_9BACT|nr:hypothetical protein [Cyclobacterium qasimii]GEO23547.1 hypothetical protein CQA01_40810 [Cyclobacterium qasimii]
MSIGLTFILATLSAYWSENLSDKLIYFLYGFDPYGMGESERWTNEIRIEDRKTIEQIFKGSLGVGWPLKLIMVYIIFIIPYNLITCLVIYSWKRKKLLIVPPESRKVD